MANPNNTAATESALRGPALDFSMLDLRPVIVDRAPVAVAKPVDLRACCANAVRVHCVCVASYRCPTHDAVCVGSHD